MNLYMGQIPCNLLNIHKFISARVFCKQSFRPFWIGLINILTIVPGSFNECIKCRYLISELLTLSVSPHSILLTKCMVYKWCTSKSTSFPDPGSFAIIWYAKQNWDYFGVCLFHRNSVRFLSWWYVFISPFLFTYRKENRRSNRKPRRRKRRTAVRERLRAGVSSASSPCPATTPPCPSLWRLV